MLRHLHPFRTLSHVSAFFMKIHSPVFMNISPEICQIYFKDPWPFIGESDFHLTKSWCNMYLMQNILYMLKKIVKFVKFFTYLGSKMETNCVQILKGIWYGASKILGLRFYTNPCAFQKFLSFNEWNVHFGLYW